METIAVIAPKRPSSSPLDNSSQAAASDDDEIRTLYDQDHQEDDEDPNGNVTFQPYNYEPGENDPLLSAESNVPENQSSSMFVVTVFYLLGMATLLPWNFFISVNSFWDYKFRDVNETRGKTVYLLL